MSALQAKWLKLRRIQAYTYAFIRTRKIIGKFIRHFWGIAGDSFYSFLLSRARPCRPDQVLSL